MPVVPKHQTSMGPDATPSPPSQPDGIDPRQRRKVREYFEGKDGKDPSRLNFLRLSNRTRHMALLVAVIVGAAALLSAWVMGRLEPDHLLATSTVLLGVATLTVVLALVALALRPADEILGPEEMEAGVDRVRDHDTGRLLASARKLLGDQRTDGFDLTLYGYPDKELCAAYGLLMAARLSHDLASVRFTPVAVTAIKLEERSIAIYQGTVDLITGSMAQERLVEVAYRDIAALERSSLGMRTKAEVEASPSILPARRRDRMLRDKDTLTIRFANATDSVPIVLRDSSFTGSTGGVRLPLSHPHEAVEDFWKKLRKEWLAAIAR